MSNKPAGLPLREALEAYGNPALVTELRKAIATPLPSRSFRDSSGVDPYLLLPGIQRARRRILWQRQQARRALEDDFRQRIGRGELQLVGLKTKPTLATAPARIQPAWAPLLRFMKNDVVIVEDHKFTNATVYRVSIELEAMTDAPEALEIEPTESPPKRRRGREGVYNRIEECLRRHWADVQSLVARSPDHTPASTALADLVRKRWGKLFPAIPCPKRDTVRRHTQEAYRRVMAQNAGIK